MMMVKLLSEVEKLTIPYQEHSLSGGFTMSINTIAGGIKTNVVPDHCVATVDMRTVPGQDHRPILKQNVVDEVTGKKPALKEANYYSDAVAFVPVLKAPMILCGPEDVKLAHQPNEHVEVSKLIEAANIYTLAAIELLQ